jgi:hypothetical protein
MRGARAAKARNYALRGAFGRARCAVPSAARGLGHGAAIVISMVMGSDLAWGDMAHDLVVVGCDSESVTAFVELYVTHNDEVGPDGSIDATKLLHRTVVCDFGGRGTVAVEAGLSEDHPRDDTVTIYINNTRVTRLWYMNLAPEPHDAEVTIVFPAGADPSYCIDDDQSRCTKLRSHQ